MLLQEPLSPMPGPLSHPFSTPPHSSLRWLGVRAKNSMTGPKASGSVRVGEWSTPGTSTIRHSCISVTMPLGYLHRQQVAIAAPHQQYRPGNPPRQVPRYLRVGTQCVGANRRVHHSGFSTFGKGLDGMTGGGLLLPFAQGAEPDPLLPVPSPTGVSPPRMP